MRSGSVVNSALLASETAIHRFMGAYDPIDILICPSRFLLEKLVEAGFDRGRLRYIPNFTSVPPNPHSLRREGAVLSVGRLSQEKGIDALIRACALAPARRLRIVGEGPLGCELRALAQEEAPGMVEFLGHIDRDRVIAEIDAARVVAFPARGYENMPLAIIEAMARGTPVIVTDIGGSPELVPGEKGGICVPPDDPVAMRSAIERLDEESVALRMGAAGAAAVPQRFSPAVHLSSIETLYQELVTFDAIGG